MGIQNTYALSTGTEKYTFAREIRSHKLLPFVNPEISPVCRNMSLEN